MQIIFDQKLVPELQKRYVVLELDTILQPGMKEPLTLYALVENLDLQIITNLPILVQQHYELIQHYKSGQWLLAESHAHALHGSWRGELDEFYDLVLSTCREYIESNTTWNGVRFIVPSE